MSGCIPVVQQNHRFPGFQIGKDLIIQNIGYNCAGYVFCRRIFVQDGIQQRTFQPGFRQTFHFFMRIQPQIPAVGQMNIPGSEFRAEFNFLRRFLFVETQLERGNLLQPADQRNVMSVVNRQDGSVRFFH